MSSSERTVWFLQTKWVLGRRSKLSHSCPICSTSSSFLVHFCWLSLFPLSMHGKGSVKSGHRSWMWLSTLVMWQVVTWWVFCQHDFMTIFSVPMVLMYYKLFVIIIIIIFPNLDCFKRHYIFLSLNLSQFEYLNICFMNSLFLKPPFKRKLLLACICIF